MFYLNNLVEQEEQNFQIRSLYLNHEFSNINLVVGIRVYYAVTIPDMKNNCRLYSPKPLVRERRYYHKVNHYVILC